MYPMDAVSLSGITPSSYAHRSEGRSQLVHVHFCPRCGSTVSLTFERWPQVRGLSRGAFDDPNSVSIGSHIWTESAQTGVVLPADTDCFRQARATLNGTPLAPERYAEPVLARPEG
jgi:hypothetical protein